MIKLRLLAGAYAPLFLLLAIRFSRLEYRIACSAVFAIGVVAVVRLIWVRSSLEPAPHMVDSSQDDGQQTAAFLATYLLPFVTISTPQISDLVAYGIFLALVGVILLRIELLQIQPVLYCLGYRVFRITTTAGFSGWLVAPGQVSPGLKLLAVPVVPGGLKLTQRVEED